MRKIRKRLTFANIVACLALFVALGGASYAATQLPKNSVGSKQIQKNAVNSAKVKDHSLKAVDFQNGQLPSGPKGETGPRGEKGDTGATGPEGPAGPAITGAASDGSGSVGPVGGSFMTSLAEGVETTGQLVLPFKGRITANGFADVDDSAAAISRTRCNLFISDGTGPTNGLTPFSQNAFGDTPAVSNYHIAIPVTGFVVKPAGTYNIGVGCAAVTGSTVAYSAAVTYTAVPAG